MNILSNTAKEAFLTGQLDWSATSSDTFVAVLATSDLTNVEVEFPNANDVIDLSGWSTAQAASEVLSIDTDGSGTALVPAGFTTFEEVPVQATPVTYVIIYAQGGGIGSGVPVALITDGINLPVIPNGGDITIYWNNNSGTGEVFRL